MNSPVREGSNLRLINLQHVVHCTWDSDDKTLRLWSSDMSDDKRGPIQLRGEYAWRALVLI
jgi:hypothetical protein